MQYLRHANDVPRPMKVMLIDIAVRLNAITEHGTVITPYQGCRQAQLFIFTRVDFVLSLRIKQLDPILQSVLVQQHAILRQECHRLPGELGRHRIPPSGSMPINSDQ